MPTYEYRCLECENQYEAREGFDAPPVQACPRCGGRAKRLYSAPPIVFKGSGFYATDNRARSGGGETGKDGAAPASAKTDKKTDTKSESPSKPAPSGSGSASNGSG